MNKLFTNLRGDLFGGITAGIVALPLALAFGQSSGLGATAGLYGAIFIAFFAALFGGTNTQISGPTAPMTAVSMVVVGGLVAKFNGDVKAALPSILMVFLLAGLIQIVMGLIKSGTYIKYIPYPVVSGFMTAIGVIILVTQVLPFLGYYPKEDAAFVEQFKPKAEEVLLDKILKDEAGEGLLVLENFKETIKRAELITEDEILSESRSLAKNNSSGVIGSIKTIPRALKNINWMAVALASATIIIIYGFKRITTAVPSTLVALIAVSAFAYFVLGPENYRTIEKIPGGFPVPQLDMFTGFRINKLIPFLDSAIILALLGAIDSLLTSVVADNMTKTRHDSNQELIGQGIGNSVASIFGGIPGAGATIRTVVNIDAGGKTKLSGMIAGILLLVILLALGPVASNIPAAVLAGILITVGIGVMDYKGLKAMPKMPKSESFIIIVVLILAVVWNLVYAVGIGLVVAALVFMKKMADLTTKKSKVQSIEKEPIWSDERSFPERFKEEVFIKHIDGPLFFGATSDLVRLSGTIPNTAKAVILRMDKVPYIDQSGLYALEDILLNLKKKNVDTLVVGLQEQPKYLMENIDIIPDLVKEEHLFDDFAQATDWVVAEVEDIY